MAVDGRIEAAAPAPAGSSRWNMRAPVRLGWCVLGWVLASALFVGSVALWYDGLIRDQWETAVPTLAITHGTPSCAYPTSNASSVPPLVPLVDAGLLSATGVGAHAAFPYVSVDHRCDRVSLNSPIWRTGARPFVILALFEWLALLGGFVACLRSAGLGRTRWEIAGACLIAALPATAATIVEYFHPEDLVALGLVLAALAAALRQRWLASGFLVGLACCSKQYALLAAVPLAVAVPRGSRLRFGLAAVAVPVALLVPLGVAMGQGVLKAALGSAATPTGTGTLVGRLNLQGLSLTAVSRGIPLVVTLAVALLARRRLGPRLVEPAPMLALIGIAFALRLLFEVNVFGYYFMALAVVLITIDIVSGRLRIETIGWVVAVAGFFPPSFEQLQLVTDRHAGLVQAVLTVWALALAVAPLYRSVVGAEGTIRGDVEPVSRYGS